MVALSLSFQQSLNYKVEYFTDRHWKMLAIELILVLCSISESIAADGSFTDIVNPSGKNSTFCGYPYPMTFTKEGILVSLGYCATQDSNQSVFLTKCPYFDLTGHNITEPGYIRLPDNISELNKYMCGPMNRKDLVCKDCIDGFGPSVTSLGYKCSNCTDAWYGIPLYLVVEFVPITLFYIIILIFKVNLTSAPFVLYIFYSQMIILCLKDTSLWKSLFQKVKVVLFLVVFYSPMAFRT